MSDQVAAGECKLAMLRLRGLGALWWRCCVCFDICHGGCDQLFASRHACTANSCSCLGPCCVLRTRATFTAIVLYRLHHVARRVWIFALARVHTGVSSFLTGESGDLLSYLACLAVGIAGASVALGHLCMV